MAGLKPEFEKRNCKIIGISVDSVPIIRSVPRISRKRRGTP
jgi:alkyl hydroperoxide reductase subunit AhpC